MDEKAQLSAGVISKPHSVVRHVTSIRSGREFLPENLGALVLVSSDDLVTSQAISLEAVAPFVFPLAFWCVMMWVVARSTGHLVPLVPFTKRESLVVFCASNCSENIKCVLLSCFPRKSRFVHSPELDFVVGR